MNDALIILNPRNISETMGAFDELPITKVYLRGWTEGRIADVAFGVALSTGHDFYWVASDDIIVRPQALDAVRSLVGQAQFVTGYSQRSHTDWTVNLCQQPLDGDTPKPEAYKFVSFRDVVGSDAPAVHTTFAGMSLTGASRETWGDFPFGCFRDRQDDPGYASDFHLSVRLRDRQVPIVAARDGFCYHWRYDWVSTNDPRDATPEVGREEIVCV